MNIQKKASRSGEAKQSKSKTHSTAKQGKKRISKLTQTIMTMENCSRNKAEKKIQMSAAALGFEPKKGVGYTPEHREAILDNIRNPTSPASLQARPSPALVNVITSESSFNEIRDEGRIHLEKATVHALVFCGCVAALKAKCKSVSGGSNFGERAQEYWGLSSTGSSQAAQIGRCEHLARFPACGKALPSSMRALEALAKMPEETFEEFVKDGSINPWMTAKDVSNLTKKKDPVDDSVVTKTRRAPEEIVDVVDKPEPADDLLVYGGGEIEDAVIVPPNNLEDVEVTLAELQAEDEPDDDIASAPIIDARCDLITLDDFSSKEKKLLVKLLDAIGPEMLNGLFDDADAAVITGALPKLAGLLGDMA